MSDMSNIEIHRLERLEDTISKGLRSFLAVGAALAEIKEQQLWRFQYGSFEEYCQERWQFSASRGRQLVAAVEACATLPHEMPKPQNAAQASVLAKVDDDIRSEVWSMAIQSANDHGRHAPTTKEVKDAASRLSANPSSSKGAAEMALVDPKFRELLDHLRKSADIVDELSRTGARDWMLLAGNMAHDIRCAREVAALARPVCICPKCSGEGCNSCIRTGWITVSKRARRSFR